MLKNDLSYLFPIYFPSFWFVFFPKHLLSKRLVPSCHQCQHPRVTWSSKGHLICSGPQIFFGFSQWKIHDFYWGIDFLSDVTESDFFWDPSRSKIRIDSNGNFLKFKSNEWKFNWSSMGHKWDWWHFPKIALAFWTSLSSISNGNFRTLDGCIVQDRNLVVYSLTYLFHRPHSDPLILGARTWHIPWSKHLFLPKPFRWWNFGFRWTIASLGHACFQTHNTYQGYQQKLRIFSGILAVWDMEVS